MKNLFKKLKIVCLILFFGLETLTLIPQIPLYQSAQSEQGVYTLGRFNRSHYIRPPQNQQSQSDTLTSVSLPNNTQESGNWGGYIVTPASSTNNYTSVSGSWTIPNITSDQPTALAGQWVGLGGVSTTDLLQIGTIEQLENGQPVAEVFWEKLPDVAQNIMTIPIGSTINACIYATDGSDLSWDLTFTAVTPNGETKSQTISVDLDSSYAQNIGTSAEWISEDPSSGDNQLYPLANMGTVKYSSALANGLALDSSENEVKPVAMVSSRGNVLIAPSALGTDGESFSTTVLNSDSSTSSSRGIHHEYPSILPDDGMSVGWSIHIDFFGW